MAAPTKTTSGLLMLALAIGLAGCAARAKSVAANPAAAKPVSPSTPPAPAPLSTPQTQFELPKEQPIDLAATATEVPTPTPAEPPAPTRTLTQPPRRTPNRTEPTTATPQVPVVPAEPERQPVQSVVSAADLKRFQDSAQNRKREVARILAQLKHPSKAQQSVVNSIRSFVSLSDEAEKRNDMGQADALAERAQILAHNLQNGK